MGSLKNSIFEGHEVICMSVTRQLTGQNLTEMCQPRNFRISDFPKLSVTALSWWAKGRRPLGPPKPCRDQFGPSWSRTWHNKVYLLLLCHQDACIKKMLTSQNPPKPQKIQFHSKVTKSDLWGLPQTNPRSHHTGNFLT